MSEDFGSAMKRSVRADGGERGEVCKDDTDRETVALVSAGKVPYGVFPDRDTAEEWVEQQPHIEGATIWYPVPVRSVDTEKPRSPCDMEGCLKPREEETVEGIMCEVHAEKLPSMDEGDARYTTDTAQDGDSHE